MKVIGITGGIASGKTTVSNLLKEFGYPVIDADVIARQIVEKGKPALEKIRGTFGEEVIQPDGTLNRKRLAQIVFSDPEQRKKLNDITHGPILDEILREIDFYKNNSAHKIVFVDAALLIEMNMVSLVDEVWLIAVDRDIQQKRLMERDGLNETEALKRIESQMSLEAKKKYATIIIDNSKDFEHLKNQVMEALKGLFGGI
ncbi:MAG TPA: dephospho-CoA kinase [Clostridiales bacterium]|nr:dephospho-CoA kinase [Clostridiales bacterium]